MKSRVMMWAVALVFVALVSAAFAITQADCDAAKADAESHISAALSKIGDAETAQSYWDTQLTSILNNDADHWNYYGGDADTARACATAADNYYNSAQAQYLAAAGSNGYIAQGDSLYSQGQWMQAYIKYGMAKSAAINAENYAKDGASHNNAYNKYYDARDWGLHFLNDCPLPPTNGPGHD